jgi:hypothetical protein
MSPTTTTKNGSTSTREQDLLKTHRELVAEYPASFGAAKAQIVRKLNIVQMELDLLGAEYDYWQKPEPVVTRSYVHTPEELLARIAGLRKLLAREDRNEASKQTAQRALDEALKQAQGRGIEVPAA